MIKIGVSACLLGQNVRYDGQNKFANIDKYFDPTIFKLAPICPEVEMGLSIPRPAIQLINNGKIKLVQVDDHSIDFTQQMQSWFEVNMERISGFYGFILKSKSPSCGNQTTPYYLNNYKKNYGDGLFVLKLKQQDSSIPIINENQINDSRLLKQFLEQAKQSTL